MRSQLLKLRRSNSTKSERWICEILKNNKIKFRTKVKIGKYEVDFLVGRVIIEVDGLVHQSTNTQRDVYLFSQGYIPIHIITHGRRIDSVENDLIHLIKNNG